MELFHAGNLTIRQGGGSTNTGAQRTCQAKSLLANALLVYCLFIEPPCSLTPFLIYYGIVLYPIFLGRGCLSLRYRQYNNLFFVLTYANGTEGSE